VRINDNSLIVELLRDGEPKALLQLVGHRVVEAAAQRLLVVPVEGCQLHQLAVTE